MRTGRRALPWLIALSWLALAGYILGRFANDAFPTYYLYRPLAGAVPFAVVIGVIAYALGPRRGPVVVAGLAAILAGWVTVTRFWIPVVVALGAWLVAWWVLRRRGRELPLVPDVASTLATVAILAFFAVGLGRAVLTFEGPIDPVVATQEGVAAGGQG